MPKPVCVKCNSTESLLWRPNDNGQICNDCFISETLPKTVAVKSEQEEVSVVDLKQESSDGTPAQASGKSTRKSTRSTRFKLKNPASTSKPGPPKGRGRRTLFKRPPLKAPTATATIVTSDTIYFKGSYMQVGDIVAVIDEEGGTYYAQIRGFLTDQYCEKSAVLTWLLPTKASPPPAQCFDPATYIIGPEDDLPRKLDYMEFIMHAPSDYYKSTTSPYPPVESEIITKPYSGFVWASMDPVDR